MKQSVNRLNAKEQFDLTNLVVGTFATTGLSDAAFAKMATETLRFDVTEGNVASIRRNFGIASNNPKPVAEAERIRALEICVADLSNDVERLKEAVARNEKRLSVFTSGVST